MKDQYFGDINDYRKFGLLRALLEGAGSQLLVAWMLTPDDGGPDGRFRSYLQNPEGWRTYDPALFDELSRLLGRGGRPAVSSIEESELLPATRYYSRLVPDPRSTRRVWQQGLLDAAQGTDLVFLDPDNGIEVRSKPSGHKGSSKYVLWLELEALWQSGHSLLVYQHFPREPREAFVDRMVLELRERLGARLVGAICTAHVVFLLVVQGVHAGRFEPGLARLSTKWRGQLESVGLVTPL